MNPWKIAALALGVLGAAAPVQAAEPPKPEATETPVAEGDEQIDPELAELLDEPIVTTASKRSEKVSTAPATVFTITAEEIRLHGIRTVTEAINYLGNSVTAQQPYDEVGARGLLLSGDGGNHMLVVVNGHAMNSEWGGWQSLDRGLGIPIELIERIEISLGPSSVLYGTSAMFGVINVVTKAPATREGLHGSVRGAIAPAVGADGRMRPSGQGYRVGHEARASFGWGMAFRKARRGGGVSFQLEAYEQAAPSTSFGPQTATYEPGPHVATPGVWGGVSRRFSRGATGMASLHVGRWQIDVMGGGHQQYDPFDYDSDFADPRNRTTWTEGRVDARHGIELGTRTRLDSRVYVDGGGWVGDWIYSDATYWCPGLETRCHTRERSPWMRTGIEEKARFDWLHDGRLVTLVGAEGRVRWLRDSVSIRELEGGRETPFDMLDAQRVSAMGAFYVQQTWWPVQKLALDAGLRLDLDQNFGWHLSPRASITVLPWHLGNLKLLYAEAFRAPGMGELIYEDPNYYLRAEQLRPEVVRSLELTGEQRFPGGHGSLKIGGFYNWWSDLIAEAPISQAQFDGAVANGKLAPEADIAYVVQYQNQGRIDAFGGFAALQAHALDRRFQFGLNVGVSQAASLADGRVTRPLALYPTALGNARIAWVPRDPIPSLGLVALYNSPRRTSEEVSGAFVSAKRAGHHGQLRATIDGAIPGAGGLRYSVSVDHGFARYGAYMVGPNRGASDASWGGELYPLPRTTVMFGLRFDQVLRPPP
jgi:outer membrane receptor protein involved in Fe transport